MATGDARDLRRYGWLAPLVTLPAIALYYWWRYRDAVGLFFALDDFWVLENTARIHLQTLADVSEFFRPGHNKFLLYRPLTTVGYFFVLRLLFGYDSSGYHATQLLMHALNAWLVWLIVRREVESESAAWAAMLIYAAAPGHSGAIFPLCNFTMTGSVTPLLVLVWLWLRTEGRSRAVLCTIVQAVALLASEHAIVGPLLLGVVACFGRRRNSRRRAMTDIMGPIVLTAMYVLAKVYYLTVVRPLHVGESCAPGLNVWRWLVQVGGYASACVDVLALLPLGERTLAAGGTLIIGLTTYVAWRTWRGDDRYRLLALGMMLFLASLAVVVPLGDHFFAHYIGVAALGAALAAIGLCQSTTRRWRPAIVAVAIGLVAVDVASGGRAARTDPVYTLYRGAAEWSARWVYAVENAASSPSVREVLVPRSELTGYVFGLGRADALFLNRPKLVTLYGANAEPRARVDQVVLREPPDPIPAMAPLPGWHARFDWLRRVAGRNVRLNEAQ